VDAPTPADIASGKMEHSNQSAATKRQRIAWLSPFPLQPTGIANYSSCLVNELKSVFDIDLFYDGEPPSDKLRESFATYPLTAFTERRGQYHRGVYHLGNNHKFHTGIYRLAWNLPDTIVLHDYDLSGFMHEAFFHTNDDLYFQALPNGYAGLGRRAVDFMRRLISPVRQPMTQAIVSRSRKVIVHHHWVKRQFENNSHIEVIPHFAKLNYTPTDSDLRDFRNRIGLKDNHFVLVCLGFTNPNKLPRLQIEAVKRLLGDGLPVQLVFAGEPAPELSDLVREVRAGDLKGNIIFTGYQSEVDYFCTIALADVVINLRNPSMGEASGTLIHALAAAKPTIISDVNQYREFPDDVCWKLAHGQSDLELLSEGLRKLLTEPVVGAAIAARAAAYVEDSLAMAKVRGHWIRALEV
jgi:glycosyltransferase involved in cell wall biosynthesis